MADLTENTSIQQFFRKFGNKVVAIRFDNDEFWWFDQDKEKISDVGFESIGGVDYIKKRGFLNSKEGGPNGGISKLDIPTWTYKPIDMIQGIHIIENEEDLKRIDFARFYV